MHTIDNFTFRTNVSLDYYEKKSDATACLSREGANAIGKNKMAFTEVSITVPQFLELATSGHAFCNLYDYDPNQKYWVEISDGKMTQTYPVYKNGPNKGAMKLSTKSDQDIEQLNIEISRLEKNSSNQVSEVNRTTLTACKLVDLWKYGSYNYQQKIQYLVFPDGLIWDKEKGKPRTTRENEVLMTIRLINNHLQKGTGQEKTGKSVDFPAVVAGGGLEPPTSGL